jgi:hypothetical protein
MGYTLGEAARAAGVSKTSIKRSLDSGRLSASKDEFGRWSIEPVELHRVYLIVTPSEQAVPSPELPDTKALQTEVTLLREMLEREREISHALEAERDAWRQQAQSLLPPPQRPWWRFWR